MEASEVKKQTLETLKTNAPEFKRVAHSAFIKGWLRAFGWSIIPKKYLLKWAEKDWQKIEDMFDFTPLDLTHQSRDQE